jgi:hypothetical protein
MKPDSSRSVAENSEKQFHDAVRACRLVFVKGIGQRIGIVDLRRPSPDGVFCRR